MKQFWDERYAVHDHVYGMEPNAYFKSFIDQQPPGTLLLPAEGEGRNALYAASKGWVVEAFDFSPVAREKALQYAAERSLKIRYDLRDIESYISEKKYDVVALLYVHLPEQVRHRFHEQIYKSVKPGGFLLLEAFAKEQLAFDSGGPKDPALLYDAPSICRDFPFLHLISCEQKEVILNEGDFHKGKAAVLRLTGQRL
ncbi:MAG: class I SAM-dependent methyltransferase [Chitinophagales bacterium]|nr:class I SAM-dependent methyltransferase [Chitinophagales bacterium]